MKIEYPFLLILYVILCSFILGAAGICAGLWADKFDNMATITNFVIVPLSFLSGTFYSISRLPEFWQNFALFNPFFYNIDGLRYAFIGQSDSELLSGAIILLILNVCLFFLCYLMFKEGYKLKF